MNPGRKYLIAWYKKENLRNTVINNLVGLYLLPMKKIKIILYYFEEPKVLTI